MAQTRPIGPRLAAAVAVALAAAACGSSAASSVPPTSTAAPSAAAGAAVTASSIASTPPASPTAPVVSPSSPIRALDAHLLGPDSLSGLAFDAAGNLYVSQCQTTYAAIDRIDANGMLTMFAGTGEPGFSGDGGPATSAHLFCPYGMALGPDGALYVADHINNRVRRIDAAGTITTIAGSGPAGLNLGSFSGDSGPATKATLQEPTAVAFDAAGNLYISDRDNNRIRRVDPRGIISTIAGNGIAGATTDGVAGSATSLDTPYGVVADAKGDVIFVDGGHGRVRMVDRHGIITTIAGTGTDASTGDGGLATKAAIEPQYVALDAAGNLYVTDDLARSLRRIDRHGIITTVAGNGGSGSPRDGLAALSATFADMTSPTFDAAGNLYVTDLTCVYRIDENGVLTTVAGKRP